MSESSFFLPQSDYLGTRESYQENAWFGLTVFKHPSTSNSLLVCIKKKNKP